MDQIYDIHDIVRSAIVEKGSLLGVSPSRFDAIYSYLFENDTYTCEHFLQRLYDAV